MNMRELNDLQFYKQLYGIVTFSIPYFYIIRVRY